jgi:hypothetical protein
MTRSPRPFPGPCAVAFAALALVPLAPAQEAMAPREPAPELKRLEPLIGSWSGKGTVDRPRSGRTQWQAEGSYRWSHAGCWLQEDMIVHFAGTEQPVAVRAYLGWDKEDRRYVMCCLYNDGDIRVDEFEFLPDGTLMTVATLRRPLTFAERTLIKVDGDVMTHEIGLLLPDAMLDYGKGTFRRVEDRPIDALQVPAGGEAAGAAMQRLCRAAGVYDIAGALIVMPGAPPTKVTGTGTWTARFADRALHGHSEGAAEGTPGTYVADVFWGWDRRRARFTSFHVSNMGEVGQMDMWAASAGNTYISTAAAPYMGQPMVQRYVLTVDEAGAFTKGRSHSIIGLAEPFESFTVTYTRKQ